jgi:hypothetical protein
LHQRQNHEDSNSPRERHRAALPIDRGERQRANLNRNANACHGPKGQTVTIVGCLVQGNPAGTGDRASGAAAPNANDFFVRTPTMQVPVGATVAIGTPGTTSTATSGNATESGPSVYRITGLDIDKLKPHVGHRVELQGHLTDNIGATAERGASGTTAHSAGATTADKDRVNMAGVLHATAIKMVSASCP